MNLVQEVEHYCQVRGLRLTSGRLQLLQLLMHYSGKAMTAYGLLEQWQQQHPSVKPATVYRALDFFLQHGIIHRLNSVNGFVLCQHLGCRHSAQLFICQQCLKVEEFKDDDIAKRLQQAATGHGFRLQSQNIELNGVCHSCQQKT